MAFLTFGQSEKSTTDHIGYSTNENSVCKFDINNIVSFKYGKVQNNCMIVLIICGDLHKY